MGKQRKLFCEYGKVPYWISLHKEYLKRNIKDLLSKDKIAKDHSDNELEFILKSHTSILLRRLEGVDMRLQENKVTNLTLAGNKVNKIIVHPGEIFSFWKTIGNPTKRKGYKEGLTISSSNLKSGIGGGLCQLANMIHYLVLNSPLEVVELHHHSDALFPDERRRVPFGTGTSVFYNNVDYRFKNNLDFDIQILIWIENGELCGELRGTKELPYRYKLVEENNHFRKEDDTFYRISQVYKITIDKSTNEEIKKELILDNHSKVMYDYSLIPEDLIRND